MSATTEQIEITPMRVSLALNVVLALGIALLLAAPDERRTGSALLGDTATVVAAGEVARASQVRYPAPAGVERRGRFKQVVANESRVPYPAPAGLERRGRVKREAALSATRSTIVPPVNETSRASVRTR